MIGGEYRRMEDARLAGIIERLAGAGVDDLHARPIGSGGGGAAAFRSFDYDRRKAKYRHAARRKTWVQETGFRPAENREVRLRESGCRGRAPAWGRAAERSSWSSGEALAVGAGGRKPWRWGPGEQGSIGVGRGGRLPSRVSNRRTVGLRRGAGTPFVVGAGARKPMPESRGGAFGA